MLYVYVFLALFIAALGAFTDIRHGRVMNQHLICGLVLWLITMSIHSLTVHSFVLPMPAFVLNAGLAFVTSLIFYLTDIWAPGDCKLYIVVAIVYPVEAYAVRKGNIFPSLDIVIFAFALGYIVLLISMIRKHASDKHSRKLETIRSQFSLHRALSILSNIGLISAVNALMGTYFDEFIFANQMFCVLTVIGLICLLQQKANKVRQIFGVIGIVYFFVLTAMNHSWLSSCVTIIESLAIAVVIEVINNEARKNTYREITGDEVRPGMILSYSTMWKMQNCIDPKLPQVTTENRRSRITESQANAVKTWCKNAKSTVVIVEMIPFAPFITLAVIIQIIRYFIIFR